MTGPLPCRMARRANEWLLRAERACSELSAFMLAAIMVIVVTDVGCRYLLNSPLAWSFDVITLYLTVGLFFFALSDTLEDNGHVWVDVMLARLPRRLQHAAFALGFALSWLAFAAIAWMSVLRAWNSFVRHEVTAGIFKMPVWVSSLFVVAGLVVLLGRIAYRAVGHGASAVTGQSLIALPGAHEVHPGTE